MPTDNRLSRMLHVLIHMDRVQTPMTSETIAQMLSTNPVVVRRTMAGLRRAGQVISEKGHGGGWTLARPLSEISLLDVYRAVGEPELFSIGFSRDHSGCLVEAAVNETVAEALAAARSLLISRLGQVRLADIAADVDNRMASLTKGTSIELG